MIAKSFPEFWDKLIEQPKRALIFVLFIASVFGMILGLAFCTILLIKRSGLLPNEAKYGELDMHFASGSIDQKRRYFFVVHPQGWQETPVLLKKGDQVEIQAAGSVTIDMWGINSYSTRRDKIDKAIMRVPGVTGTPEDHYSDPAFAEVMRSALSKEEMPEPSPANNSKNLIEQIKPVRAWTGPEGYAELPSQDSAHAGREKKRISNDKYGALLGEIADPPDRDCTTEMGISFKESRCLPRNGDDIFSVTKTRKPRNKTDGSQEKALWHIVNDVLDKDSFPEKFYIDNLGFFYVEVDVTPAT